ncbi:DUF3800 domain-containing protein [Klebsiella quasipneumoniae]|uniref:DUF3800 domain-containing protein n=1 Tax=Klebsiella quasipneumoniae TaxID=1463165 RepID=UPI0003BF08F2|nr:DUF3800 domain-containing protein [Klebsiella quasipneumoniae]EIY5164297.1 DUF3800 domain-containing protein [Klebsiella quasipneumoniae]ESM63319.1 hypothetical protein L390_02016 [Klebsiella quasipneumoniae subsp. similipneumoniae]MBD8833804.1 DUF3800 domain-containing protein [Klebsiella quasipneumoniae]MBD8865138.1 DUF3800 domain-containing protein [Klebsiella quasipneumoniae]MBE5244666.1 DUF3800 domain-containing protein [Klebsiella quasipneumoniae]
MGKNSQSRRVNKKKQKNEKIRVLTAKKNKMMYTKPDIFFDESGNTGGNLLDSTQPFFTLSSSSINKADALKALELTGSKSPAEAHFKTLRRRKSGQDGIIRLLESKYVNEENVKIFLVDKKYMLTTKIVDILIETWCYNRGLDLYKNGQNLALSNVYYFCFPAFCGEEKTDKMYQKFMSMIRNQTPESIDEFYTSIDELKACSSDKRFIDTINRISITKNEIDDILEDVEKNTLDPSIPSLFKHCIEWGKLYPNGFYIKHDDSKAITEQQDIFNKFMDMSKITEVYGYDRRTFELPIKARSLTFHSSQEYPQLQIADIVASAAAYYVNCLKRNELDDYLFKELKRIKIDNYFKDMVIWPTTYVTPQELGTVYTGGLNPANGVAEYLSQYQ